MLLKKIKDLLTKALYSNGAERASYIQNAQNLIWDDETIQDESLNDILTDIAYILDFYEPNEEWRKEDPSYYGDEKLEQELKSAITKLEDFEEYKVPLNKWIKKENEESSQ